MALTGKMVQRVGCQYSVDELAPLTSKTTKSCGWRLQAEQLVSIHTTAGLAAMALVGQPQSRSSLKRVKHRYQTIGVEVEAGNALALTKPAEPEEKMAREFLVGRIQNPPAKTPMAPAASADKRIVEQSRLNSACGKPVAAENKTSLLTPLPDLSVNETVRLSRSLAENSPRTADQKIVESEDELSSAREEIIHWKNENRSLEKSLDLLAVENSRLAGSLTKKDAALEASLAADAQARSQLEHMKTALAAAQTELSELAFALNAMKGSRNAESNILSARLEAMSSRTVTAENLLADAQQSWLVHIEENSIGQREIAEAIGARDMAKKEVERLRDSLTAKERHLQELDQSRSKLIESADALLAAFKTRDTMLARSDERIKMLTERVAQLEAELKLAGQREIEKLHAQLRREDMERAVAEGVSKTARTNFAEPRLELDDHIARNGESKWTQMRSTQALLADTITFCNAA